MSEQTNTQATELMDWISACNDVHDQICTICIGLAKMQAAMDAEGQVRLANAYLALSRARVELAYGANHLFALQVYNKQHTVEAVAQ